MIIGAWHMFDNITRVWCDGENLRIDVDVNPRFPIYILGLHQTR